MEFDEVREYQFGDDIKNIDWNVTARSNHLYTKKFMEERELTINIILDVSASMRFGTVSKLKSEMAAEVTALITLAALKNGDKVGLTLFSDKVEQYYPPAKKKDQLFQVIRDILVYPHQGRASDLAGAIEFLQRVQRKRSVVFIISDMIADGYDHALRLLAGRHDVHVLLVGDPAEIRLDRLSSGYLEDPEKGGIWPIRPPFLGRSEGDRPFFSWESLQKDLLRKNIRSCQLLTSRDAVNDLILHFRKR
jgi:uncharacterized protein (DUF58 family)